ncbi:MAG: M3 family oligoendopeptidase [Fervidobacterium sp.]|uniref:M3 family oligoendopeptidase n=1 Tax=Fervidobacterium sp. TaxID=1871331 RepID=UPI004048EAF2
MVWNLEEIFQNDTAAIENAKFYLSEVKRYVEEFENEQELGRLVELIKKIEDSTDNFAKSSQYAWMRYSTDTESSESQKLIGSIQQLETELSESLVKMEVKLAALDDASLEKMIDLDKNYEHELRRIMERRKHLLSKEAEQVLALMSVSGRGAISKIHSRLESAYTFDIEIDGQFKTLTVEEIKALRRSPDSQLRKRAMKIFFERFQNDSMVITEVYNLIVKNYDTESKIRRFPKPISMMNFENEVSDEVVDKLIEVTDQYTNLVRRYYDWKSKKLGEKLTLADIYAPISAEKRTFTFDEAKDVILESYYAFNQSAGDIVKGFFDTSRIDLLPKKGKVGGAYCIYSTTKLPPYVLTNFNGDIYDVMTLAHELGHGLHGTLSRKQTFFNHDTPLTLAELASVFGEFLVFDNLKNKLSKKERMALLASKIEDTIATTFRQNMFTKFELRAHEKISTDGYADWNELNEIYHDELKNVFGDVVEIPEWYNNEWAMVSHFFETPFYVYAYNFAHCLVITLYQKYLEEGKAFADRYLKLLESGGKYTPEELLASVGIDVKEEGFWDKAFRFIEHLVDELEEISRD